MEAFLGLRPLDARTFELPVTRGVCSGLDTLFGGSALGAAAQALERTVGRRVRWLSGQFLAFARPGDVVRLEVEVLAEGRRLTQARVVGRTEVDVFHAAATLGEGGSELRRVHVRAPAVPAPEDCPPRPVPPRLEGTVIERMGLRLARGLERPDLPEGHVGEGRSAFWARVDELGGSAAALALLGDLIPAGVVTTLARRGVGSSLDHTVRVHRDLPATWLLVEVRTQAIEGGLAHALAHVFDPEGVLRGTASQTTVLRLR